ncbi:hypothetical protein V2J09_005176, partial [Rumex salicifolius]
LGSIKAEAGERWRFKEKLFLGSSDSHSNLFGNPMSLICGMPILECVYCLGCARWAWQRCLYTAGNESENWGVASSEEFEPVPRLCRYILAFYEHDIRNPIWAPPGGYGVNPDWIVLRKDHSETQGRCTPYMIYLDHDNADVVLAIRGLNMGIESDYAVLFDNKLGQAKFHGGYVHNGLLKAANWVFDSECEVLRGLLEENPGYTLTFAGHSLGAGVVALLTIVAVQNLERLGSFERKRVRCYAMAPTRCMSLNLAVRYADVINSIVLQDDFLPRTTAALEDVYNLPCLLCIICLKDTCKLEEKMITDPRRLYAPGRIYHIVERKSCSPSGGTHFYDINAHLLSYNTRKTLQFPLRNMISLVLNGTGLQLFPPMLYADISVRYSIGRVPPVVRTAVPVDGRFEHIVLSCNATADHAIIWIERESQEALNLMLEKDQIMEIPYKQRMERQEVVAREHSQEHKEALQRAYALDVPHSSPPPSIYGTFNEQQSVIRSYGNGESSLCSSKRRKESWGELFNRIFDTDESGDIVLKKSDVSPQSS